MGVQDIAEEEGFAVGVTEERQETKFCESGEGDGGHIDEDRLTGEATWVEGGQEEGSRSFDELNELVVASLQPLQTVGASESRAEGEGRARGVKVEDNCRRRRDKGGG
jgi:hypothetical protein